MHMNMNGSGAANMVKFHALGLVDYLCCFPTTSSKKNYQPENSI